MSAVQRRPLGLIIALSASVLINGVVIGAGIVGWVHGARITGPYQAVSEPRFPGIADLSMRRLAEALTPAERRRALSKLRQAGERAGPILRDAAASRRAAERALRSEPFDAAAVSAALERARSARLLMAQRGDAALVSILADLTPERRAEILSTERLRRGPGFRRRPGGPPRDGAHAEPATPER
ncbi:MAG: periplasmic heavy metal sensor [Maricaulaceae bacterium]